MRGRIGAVLEWAIAMNYRTDNPCDRVGQVLGPQREIVGRYPIATRRCPLESL